MNRWLPICLLLTLAGCATTPEADPVAVKLGDVDTRLGRVESVVNNQSLVDLSRRIDALEAQLRQLRGGVEEVQNGNESVRKQQRDLYADLDRRLGVLESGAKAGAGIEAVAGTPPAAGASDDVAAYGHAFDALKAGEYGSAITQFRSFADSYPKSALLDNAQYWLGEAYYVTRDYDQAAASFRMVGERWPNSRKAPDALLKLGFTQYEKKRTAEARATLQQVVARFPNSEAARLATDRLAKITAESR
jgi:tol-pal system protein YbgF